MAVSSKKLIKIKVDFEAGILTKSKIASKHKINRLTLYNLADKHEWQYGKNEQKINKITETKSLEVLIEKQVDRAAGTTDLFLSDIKAIRGIALAIAKEWSDSRKAGRIRIVDGKEEKIDGMSKDEADRIFAQTKIAKITMETLNIGYTAARKALGMDRDDDVEKARRIKTEEKQPLSNPTEGMTREEVQEEIKKLRNR